MTPGTLRIVLASALVLAYPVALAAQETQDDAPPEREPLEIGFTERTGVRRLFIDVEAVDGAGRPLPGLVKEDFKIRLNYSRRPILTVDDLCPCSADGEMVTPAVPDPLIQAGLDETRTRYVLYLELSQLAATGRSQAFGLARRWVREVMTGDDEAMVVAYASEPGLRRFTAMTSDKKALMSALDAIENDPSYEDPFPDGLIERVEQCADGTVSCNFGARQDYFHSRRSLQSLMGFLTRMESLPGRKAVLLFHQNMAMFPGRLYVRDSGIGPPLDSGRLESQRSRQDRGPLATPDPGSVPSTSGGGGSTGSGTMLDGRSTDTVPDLVELAEDVGAAATMSRTELHVINVGSLADWTVNLGANFADFSGGSYNDTLDGAPAVLSGAGRGCRCIYRIGVEPPTDRTQVYRVKVKVKGQALPGRLLVHVLSPRDQWVRRSAAVLQNPADAWDLDVAAALLPSRSGRLRWELEVRVAFDRVQLQASEPDDGQPCHEWEVGAVLARHDEDRTRKTWEMLGVSRAPAAGAGGLVVHRRLFRDLRPGTYELRAFIRDRNGEAFGGSRIELGLPDPAKGGIAGPVLLRGHGDHQLASLPLRDGWEMVDVVRSRAADDPWVPIGEDPLRPGEPLSVRTWHCRGEKDDPGSALSRRVADANETLASFGDSPPPAPGRCTLLDDPVDTSDLESGVYEYVIEPGGEVPTVIPFRVER